jgi:quercetin dioxygenase-like cupin family protein
MQRYRAAAILLVLTSLVAATGVVSGQTPPSNVTRHTTRADIVPQAGPLEVYQLIIDFVPGAASAIRYHSGTSHNTVLAGELTIRYVDGERVVGVGESWTDAPFVVHQAMNLGDIPATVAASFVQPRGTTVSIPVASLQSPAPIPPGLPATAEFCEDVSVTRE